MKFKNSKSAKICIRTQRAVVCAILPSVTHMSKETHFCPWQATRRSSSLAQLHWSCNAGEPDISPIPYYWFSFYRCRAITITYLRFLKCGEVCETVKQLDSPKKTLHWKHTMRTKVALASDFHKGLSTEFILVHLTMFYIFPLVLCCRL